jgi:hypothetical protein
VSVERTKNFNRPTEFAVNFSEVSTKPVSELSLPTDFIPMTDISNSIEYKNALRYLLKRNITKYDMLRYNIGYCERGEFSQRIIVPSYSKEGKLDFFVGRSYYDASLKYNNSVASKDFVGFGSFIDFNQEITLVEGVFDAFSVRYNCIPLFGKTLSKSLKTELLSNKTPSVNVLLDSDAVRESIRIIEFLLRNNIKTRFINIGEKDPSVLGFDNTWKTIRSSEFMDFEKLVSMKLKIL